MELATFTSEEALRLFESGPTILFKWKAADRWPVEYVSPNVAQQLGYQPSDFMEGRLLYAAIVHPDDLPRVGQEVLQHSQAGAPYFEQDYRIVDGQGRVRFVYDFTVVRRDPAGIITHYYGYLLDVTARRLAQDAARESGAKYKAMVEAYDGQLYICSRDFRVEFMNRPLIERTGRNAVGEPCYKALHDRDSVCPWCVNESVFEGRTVRWEVLSPKDNRWYYVVNVPLTHPDGRMSKMAMIQDITERKQAEALARRRERILETIGFASQLLMQNPAWEKCMPEVLERIGQAVAACRVSYYEITEHPGAGVTAERRYEWTAMGFTQQLFNPAGSMLHLQAQGFTRWVEHLGRGLVAWCRADECSAAEQSFLKAYQLGALILFPLFVGSRWHGFLGIEAPTPSFDMSPIEIEGLKTMAGLLGSAIQRQQAEQAMRRNEERNAILVNALPDLMLRFDRNGALLDIKADPGTPLPPREELIGRKLREVFPAPVARQFAEAHALLARSPLQVFTTALLEGSAHCYEVRLVPGIKGEALAIVRDVTAARKGEAAIAKLAAFPLNNPNPVFEFAEDGRVLFCNQSSRKLSDSLGLPGPESLLPPDAAATVRACLATGQPIRNVVSSVENRKLLWSFSPILDSRTVHGYGYETPPA